MADAEVAVEVLESPVKRYAPSLYVSLLSQESELEIRVFHNPPSPHFPEGYPVVNLGSSRISWQPDRSQLVELRDKIDAYLAAHPEAPEPSSQDQPQKKQDWDPEAGDPAENPRL